MGINIIIAHRIELLNEIFSKNDLFYNEELHFKAEIKA